MCNPCTPSTCEEDIEDTTPTDGATTSGAAHVVIQPSTLPQSHTHDRQIAQLQPQGMKLSMLKCLQNVNKKNSIQEQGDPAS